VRTSPAGGATFRLWAPGAQQIYICGDFNAWAQDASSVLSKGAADYWAGVQESTWFEYAVGFPRPGAWIEAFNSDVYDNWVNPWAVGNGGGIGADGGPLHGLPASARITIPANGVVVFTRDRGD